MGLDTDTAAEHDPQAFRSEVRAWLAAHLPLLPWPEPAELTAAADPTAEFLVATATGGQQALWFFAEDKDLSLTSGAVRSEVRPVAGGLEVTVQATGLVRHLAVLADRWHPDAVAQEALVTLLPGQSAVLTVDAPPEADPTTFSASGALRCLNDVERVD